ncbi:hypothetical protein P5673_005387 [Acropora cervicornis]|uniref:Uncharacterized protein n=1 Tax=Acropora cervicornis TaxID=6130 RepID=A0AAD9QY97_ACRCE|nr:hypothetical protein P5673_005387 [Acropora cervicornis]
MADEFCLFFMAFYELSRRKSSAYMFSWLSNRQAHYKITQSRISGRCCSLSGRIHWMLQEILRQTICTLNKIMAERWSCDVKLSGKDEEMKVHWLSGCSEFHSKLFVMHWFEFQLCIVLKVQVAPNVEDCGEDLLLLTQELLTFSEKVSNAFRTRSVQCKVR